MDQGYAVREDRSVRFVVAFPGASSVRLAGDFTGWGRGAVALKRREDGLWETRTGPLDVGLHAYKYVVDDAWHPDPAHDDRRADGVGGHNSTLLVHSKELDLGGMRAVRIAGLNLRTWQEPEPHAKLDVIASVFAALDVHAAALQEVGQHRTAPHVHPNAGEVLRKRLEETFGVPWVHVWRSAHVGFDVYDEGLSVLSRVPIDDVAEHELGGRTWRRIAVAGTLRLRQPLRLVSVHTSWPGDGGDAEVRALLRALEGDDRRAVLLSGDFNATAGTPPMARLRDAGFEDVGASLGRQEATFFGGDRIDYQLLRRGGASLRASALTRLFHGTPVAGVAQPRVSDHAGLLGVYTAG